jgi:hypothetical protein
VLGQLTHLPPFCEAAADDVVDGLEGKNKLLGARFHLTEEERKRKKKKNKNERNEHKRCFKFALYLSQI